MSRQTGYDRHITIFSPEGRLFQIEYTLAAVKNQQMTSVAIRGEDCVVMVVQKKVAEKLMDPGCVTSLFNITPRIGCALTGMMQDGKALVMRARQIASKFEAEFGYEIPVHFLSQKVANIAQVYTQHAYMRPYGVTAFFSAIDDEKGPQLYKVQPTGTYLGYKACSAGTKEDDANNGLEKIVKSYANKVTQANEKRTIEDAINCLQTVLGIDFKMNDCEVGVVANNKTEFRRLTPEEIDTHLNNIAERD